VTQGSAAAALCSELLRSVRNTEVKTKEYPVEKKVDDLEPRIGVFVCHCGINIASVVDVQKVAEYVSSIPGVVHTEHPLYTCSQDTQKRIKEVIKEKNLNRVIVASCTPRTHEPLFQENLREAGLNKYLFEMTDIREQCSWVHKNEPNLATEKAELLVRGSIGKLRLLKPLTLKKISITRSVLVIGGGISGITASLLLAKQGFKVHLIEKQDRLGGNLLHLQKSLEGYDWQEYLSEKTKEVTENDLIDIYFNTGIEEVEGSIGNFSTRLSGENDCELKHGVILLATGAEEYKSGEFLYSKSRKVITQRELEYQIGKKENVFIRL